MSRTQLEKDLFNGRMPVSLTLDGKVTDLYNQQWERSSSVSMDTKTEHMETVLNETLKLRLNIIRYDDSDCIEWYMELQNITEYDSPIISDVDIARLQIAFDEKSSPIFIDYNGSNEQMCDFMERRTQLFHNARRLLRCEGGRASSITMPYFNLLLEDRGYTFAIGWSGQWQAEMLRPGDVGLVLITAGMENASFRLHAGEKVTLPRMLAQHTYGTEAEVFNAYRRFALKHVVPQKNGKPIQAPICLGSWGGAGTAKHLERISKVQEYDLKHEIYWIDAGWYGNVELGNNESDGSWYRNAGIGDWQPSEFLYPNGMTEISKAAHKAGLGFLLWFEPERSVCENSRVNKHPDWYIGPRKKGGDVMLDLGHPEALKWITGVMADAIRENNMRVLRIDFNYGPLKFWNYADAPDRKGISELRYVAGFYKMWDDLLKEFPELIIDNCASGGRRLDYEALRRSIPLFRTDYACFGHLAKPSATQLQTYYLARFVPVNSTSTFIADGDIYRFRSAMSAGINVDVDLESGDRALYALCNQAIDEEKRFRNYTCGNMWPLTGCSPSDQDWMAYQLHLSEEDKGVIVAYRRDACQISRMDIQLQEINEAFTYSMHDVDEGALSDVSGSELQRGWPLVIPSKRSCRMIYYRRKE